jgi:hypothetical protein
LARRLPSSGQGDFAAVPSLRRSLIVLALLAIALARASSALDSLDETGRRWVRTQNGWEQATWERRFHEPTLHPLAVATFVSLVSLTALLAFEPRACKRLPPPAAHLFARHLLAKSPAAKRLRRPGEAAKQISCTAEASDRH